MQILRKLVLLAVAIGLFAFVGSTGTPVAAATAIPDVAPNAPSTLYLPQTKHALGGSFLKYWTNTGGLTRFGFPVTEELSIKDNTGKQVTVSNVN